MGNFAGKDGDSGELMRGDGAGTPHSGGVGLQAPIPPPQEYHHRREGGAVSRGGAGGYGGDLRQPHAPGPGGTPGGDGGDEMAVDGGEDTEEDVVPTVFRWEHGGRQVYIQGTFNNWERQIPMHRSGNDFTYIHNLKRGKHAFKFIVDDEWRFAPDQLTVADVEGRINNFIDVTHFKPFNEDSSTLDIARKEDEVYGTSYPDLEEYSVKEPPPLPPHLRHIILNKVPSEKTPLSLPVPQHVAVDHLYCTAIKDGMMVLGVTQRFRMKFVTTVYYSMMP